jgi:hypothetical protein
MATLLEKEIHSAFLHKRTNMMVNLDERCLELERLSVVLYCTLE